MGDEISDDVVRIFAACGTYDQLPPRSRNVSVARQTRSTSIFRTDAAAGLVRELVSDIKRIPHVFKGFDTERHDEG